MTIVACLHSYRATGRDGKGIRLTLTNQASAMQREGWYMLALGMPQPKE